jgi:hypothetical protein
MPNPTLETTVRKLQAFGITPSGARQLVGGKPLSDPQDRKRLALILAGLLATEDVHSTRQGRRTVVRTSSGIVLELEDGAGAPVAQSSNATQSSIRTRSGVLISFDDDA